MQRSTLGRVAALGGLGLLAGAAVLRFVVVPGQAVLPADTDTTRTYEGTIETLLDAEALAAFDLGNLLITDLPIEIERHVEVTDVADGTALVAEETVVAAPDGTPVLATDATYAIDRRTMEATPTFGETSSDAAEGLVIGWPIGTEARDYEGWSSDLQSTVTAEYVVTEERGGVDTYVFDATVSNERIVNEALLSQLPAELPKAQIGTFASLLGVEESALAALDPFLAQLPDEVPLGYVYSVETRYWVEPTTGIVVDLVKDETRSVVLDVEGLSSLPVASIYDVTFQSTSESVAAAVADARDASSTLGLFGTTLPIGLAVAGLGLIAFGAMGRRDDEEMVIELDERRERELVDSTR